jgi:colicin import membrane protein
MRFLLVAGLLAAWLPSAADAFTREEERIERERIQAERAQVEAAYASRERECRGRFIVTACIEDAQRERRQALERLRGQQEVLDEAQRKQRAAQRMEQIRNKLASEDDRRRDLTVQERLKDKPPAAERVQRAAPSERAASATRPAKAASQAAAAEARRRADYDRRQQEARAHREAVEKRNAERAAKGKQPAAPLPVPASAASR